MTGEAGDAERSGTNGLKMPRAVRVFICSARWRKKPIPPRRITLDVRKKTMAANIATPTTTAAGCGM